MNSGITIIDYGMGNLGSIQNMIQKAGASSIISSSRNIIRNASKLILPGVGSFDAGMQKLHERNLIESLNDRVLGNNTPILGICLGAQLMTQSSEEGTRKGLGWLNAKTKKFDFPDNKFKVPHMGWNRINSLKKGQNFLECDSIDGRFYFVHSYHFQPHNEEIVLCKSNYGYEFASGLINNNIIALQFHPEKSHNFGLNIMKSFIRY